MESIDSASDEELPLVHNACLISVRQGLYSNLLLTDVNLFAGFQDLGYQPEITLIHTLIPFPIFLIFRKDSST